MIPLFTELINEMMTLAKVNPADQSTIQSFHLDPKNFTIRHKGDQLIKVVLMKLIDLHKQTDSDYAVDSTSPASKKKINDAKEFIEKIPSIPKNEIRYWTIEAPIVGVKISGNGISYENGRHRTIAYYELGFKEILIEVSKNDKSQLVKSNKF